MAFLLHQLRADCVFSNTTLHLIGRVTSPQYEVSDEIDDLKHIYVFVPDTRTRETFSAGPIVVRESRRLHYVTFFFHWGVPGWVDLYTDDAV